MISSRSSKGQQTFDDISQSQSPSKQHSHSLTPLEESADISDSHRNNNNLTSNVMKKYTVLEQRDTIRKIHEDNLLLKQELSIEYRESKNALLFEENEKLKKLQRQITMFSSKIEVEKKNLLKLEEQLVLKKKEIQKIREQSKCTDDNSDDPSSGVRRMRALENRLEKCLVKKNEGESGIKQFRTKIENVRKERVVFDGIYKKLEREIFNYNNLFQKAKVELEKAQKAKYNTLEELDSLRKYGEREQEEYENSFRELKSEIELTKRQAAAKARMDEKLPEDEHTVGQLTAEEEGNIQSLSSSTSWKIILDKTITMLSSKKEKEYAEVFAKIINETGIEDINTIASELLRQDDDNFKKFKHIEEMNREAEKFRAEIETVDCAIDSCKNKEGLSNSTQEKNQYKKLSQQLNEINETNRVYDSQFEDLSAELSRVKSSVQTLFNLLSHNSHSNGVEFDQKIERLGSQSITENNIMEYLMAIEDFTLQLLQDHSGNGPTELANYGPSVLSGKRTLNVDPPSAQEVYERGGQSASSDDERPLGYDELRVAAANLK